VENVQEHLQNIANRLQYVKIKIQRRERQVTDIERLHTCAPDGLWATGQQAARGTLAAARAARIDAELARCEIEELAAALHRKPPVGRWTRLAQACFGPSVAMLSG
jgi:hypothetical protein